MKPDSLFAVAFRHKKDDPSFVIDSIHVSELDAIRRLVALKHIEDLIDLQITRLERTKKESLVHRILFKIRGGK